MRAFVAVMLFCAAAPAAAQLYRWTDESGKVHFTDTPPPASARNVQRKNLPAATATTEDLPFALRQPMQESPVTLYSAPNCEGCAAARGVLNARGVPFKEVSVRTDAQIAELNRAVGGNVVPSLIVGPSVIKGFDEGSYHKALDVAGYPKPGAVPVRNQAEPKAPEAKPAEPKPAAAPPAKKGPYYGG